jgi:UDPglucose 6-dehydrogenase
MNICIIGTGYVGLVSAACFAEMGNDVHCIDNNPDIVQLLQNGKVHIYEPGLEQLVKRNYAQGRLKFSTELSKGLEDALFVFNCVGTPSKSDGTCDLSYIMNAATQIGQTMTDYKIIVNKSTVPVGTADKVRNIIAVQLEQRGQKIEFDVVSNPEFLKEGDAVNDFMKPDRVIVGTDNVRTAKLIETIYAPFARSREKLIVMGVRSAEMTKYAANCMLATKISFMNEIANICERVGADVKDVRMGIGSDRRIGYSFIYPGIGYGGSCFPKDVKALIQTARENDYHAELVSAVDNVNMRQKRILVDKVVNHFEAQGGVRGKTLAMWGLAFKASTDDIRESAALEVIKHLTEAGMKILAFDPEAGSNSRQALKQNSLVTIVEDQYQTLENADALAVTTDWNQFRNPDFNKIKAILRSPVIFDGRNLYSASHLADLGYVYFGIGRPH